MAEARADDFFINPIEAGKQIGPSGIEEIAHLQKWLYGQVSVPRYRFAPSLGSRSEAELWNVSAPRFSIRVYLDPEGHSFVNARRLHEFAQQVTGFVAPRSGKGWRRYCPPDGDFEYDQSAASKPNYAKELICRCLCLGDSFLVPPAYRTDGYHVLTVPLGAVYGEGADHQSRGTPYYRHIKMVSGGLCAQAACLMANALLHEHAPDRRKWESAGIHSVAEITAIAQGKFYNELHIWGLRWYEILRYLRRVGRAATRQVMVAIRRDSGVTAVGYFAAALRGYLRSNMPVILPVNYDLMYFDGDLPAKPIYLRRENQHDPKIFGDSAAGSVNECDHAVVAVGCIDGSECDEFLINDPARLPFVHASADQLWRCGLWSRRQPADAGQMIPVTPPEVRIGLESQFELRLPGRHSAGPPPKKGFLVGLFDIAHHLQRARGVKPHKPYPQLRPTGPTGPLNIPSHTPYHPGEWQLCRADQIVHANVIPKAHRPREESIVARELHKLGDRWCWVQYIKEGLYGAHDGIPHSLWVWNAQATLDLTVRPFDYDYTDQDRAHMEDLLLCVFVGEPGGWRKMPHCPRPDQPTMVTPAPAVSANSPAILKHKGLEPSLISSYSLMPLSDECRPRFSSHVGTELYCFMSTDPIIKKVPLAGTPHPTAQQWMDGHYRNHTQMELIAGPLLERCANAGRLVAMASFLPAISAGGPAADEAINAVCFLIKLAKHINSKYKRRHAIRNIEIVGGSRIEGLWPAIRRSTSELCFFANRRGWRESMTSLQAGICRIVGQSGLETKDQITLGLELEPGPLNILNNLGRLVYFADFLERSGLPSVVGFNLDVAHWALARIDPLSVMRQAPQVCQRVVHSHISDHGFGHFGDVAIGDVGLGLGAGVEQNLLAFGKWLQLIDNLALQNRGSGLPPFSNCISVELEAARGRSDVERSVHALGDMLKLDLHGDCRAWAAHFVAGKCPT